MKNTRLLLLISVAIICISVLVALGSVYVNPEQPESMPETVALRMEEALVATSSPMEVVPSKESAATPSKMEVVNVQSPVSSTTRNSSEQPTTSLPLAVGTSDLLQLGAMPSNAKYSVSLGSGKEPEQIPFYVETKIGNNNASKYQICFTILQDGNRASETDCMILSEDFNLERKIALESLSLAPLSINTGYISKGTHNLEIVVALIKNDQAVSYEITGDSSPQLSILQANAVELKTTGKFTYEVTK